MLILVIETGLSLSTIRPVMSLSLALAFTWRLFCLERQDDALRARSVQTRGIPLFLLLVYGKGTDGKDDGISDSLVDT